MSRGIRTATTIALTADDGWKNEQAYEQPDVYTTTTSGEVKRLTNDGYVWSSLLYSPDGQFLLSERTFGTGMIIEKKLTHGGSDDLIVWPVAGGPPINLTASWDLEPNAPRWSTDSKFVYFTAEKGGTVHLFRVAARAGAPVEQITKGERRHNSITFDKAMTRIAYTVARTSPSDVWTANLDGTGEKRLTDLFADIRAEIGMTKTERIAWRSNDGTAIEGWLTQPYGFSPIAGRIRSSSSTTAARTLRSAMDSTSRTVFRGERLLRPRHELPQLYRLRRSVQVGDGGAWGSKDGQDVVSGIDYVIGETRSIAPAWRRWGIPTAGS